MIAFDPPSLRRASIYQIFIRNYTKEGTLAAAANRLREVAELGFDMVYLTPVHPIGAARRKGSLGSPYAIADYRRVDPLLGGEKGLRSFIDEAHRLGLGVIMDIVYNHTSPDSFLVREKPSWFWKGPEGGPAPRVPEWPDVVDLDYAHRELWDYQIETLEKWARFGADGFRCDVASLVPVEFWVEARRRIAEIKPILWLAESVHKEFVGAMRRRGFYAASDPELHAAFDLTYDYDGREELEAAWRGELSLGYYLKMLEVQECMYPASATKLRFLENHDQGRAAARFGRGSRLRNWTVLSMLLPGTFMAYMGQELALDKRIGLFDRETMDESEGDALFKAFFAKAHALSRKIKVEAPLFKARLLAEGLLLVERSALPYDGTAALPPGEPPAAAGAAPVGAGTAPLLRYAALLNLDGRSGRLKLAGLPALAGRNAFDGSPTRIGETGAPGDGSGGGSASVSCLEIGSEPLLLATRGQTP